MGVHMCVCVWIPVFQFIPPFPFPLIPNSFKFFVFFFFPSSMTLFICQGDWTTRIPDSWSNVILSVSVRVFLNETKIWIRRWSKSDHLPQCGRASPDPLIAWIEYKAEERTFHPFFLSSLEHGSSPVFRLGLGLRLELIPLLLLLRPLD